MGVVGAMRRVESDLYLDAPIVQLLGLEALEVVSNMLYLGTGFSAAGSMLPLSRLSIGSRLEVTSTKLRLHLGPNVTSLSRMRVVSNSELEEVENSWWIVFACALLGRLLSSRANYR